MIKTSHLKKECGKNIMNHDEKKKHQFFASYWYEERERETVNKNWERKK